jgi:hypothetical protein
LVRVSVYAQMSAITAAGAAGVVAQAVLEKPE